MGVDSEGSGDGRRAVRPMEFGTHGKRAVGGCLEADPMYDRLEWRDLGEFPPVGGGHDPESIGQVEARDGHTGCGLSPAIEKPHLQRDGLP